MKRWLVVLLLAQTACVHTGRTPLARAADYLWAQQAADGGWHSRTYGLLRSGQSLTPFVLDALLAVDSHPSARVNRALEFIRTHTRADGALGLADADFPDYPNYATALAVKVLSRRGVQVGPMIAYLRLQQFTEQNGWRPADPAYGAWGMGGDRRMPPEPGHVDLSMTRLVVQALQAAGVPASDPVFAAAQIYIERCQNPDGGFHFTTTEFDTNKAGHDGEQFRSYGTATADGILALRAAGAPADDPRIAAASRWLAAHHRGVEASGFVGEAYQRWPQGLAFYYAATFTGAMGPDGAIHQKLQATQRADGSWSNPMDLVKEDDPLIATPFAIHALAAGVEYTHDPRHLPGPDNVTDLTRPGVDRAAKGAPQTAPPTRGPGPADSARGYQPGARPGHRE